MTATDNGLPKGFDFADALRDEGPDSVNRAIEAAEPVAPDFEGCPVIPLGHRNGEYFSSHPPVNFEYIESVTYPWPA